MAGVADVCYRFDQQSRVVGSMGQMAFEAGTDRRRAMKEVTEGVPLMAVGAEEIRRNHVAGVGAFVMAVVAAFFGEGGVRGTLLYSLLLLQFGRHILLSGLDMVITTVLLCRRHTWYAVKNGAGDLMHRQGVTRAD